jgi:hypothetical protein
MINPDEVPYSWAKQELLLDRTYKRGDKGNMVAIIQEWLTLRGQHVKIDKAFGPATESAVKTFQATEEISITGQVDNPTYTALTSPLLRALTPIALPSKPFSDLVVAYAQQHLAQHPLEIGGANCGPWVRLYMRGKAGQEWAWCAGFVCFIMNQAADTMKIPAPLKTTFECDALATAAKKKGLFVSEKDISRGKLPKSEMSPGSIFLNRKTDGDWTHTGLVIAFHKETFETIEGNTNDSGDREGYEVCRRVQGYKNKDFITIF